MKKLFFILLTAISCSAIFADMAERVEILNSKVILQNTDGYFVLSDGSCWKVMGFSKRWRSLSEWWNNVQIAPESYNCVPNDWLLGTEIQVFSKLSSLAVPETNASNQDALKQCTHLLLNTRTGQVLFAMALLPEDCIVRLFTDARDEAYKQGYTQGKLDSYHGYQDGYADGHANGYTSGYQVGYTDGYNAAFGGVVIQTPTP